MLISIIILFMQILGAVTSVVAIMRTRTAQGAIAWAISLNTFPYIAVPAYWVFGRSKFHAYTMERQEAFEATNPVAQLIKTKYIDAGLISVPDRKSVFLLEKLARLPYTVFNQVDLLIDGQQTFGAILESIERARDYVLVQFYIVHDDMVGRDLRDRLIACVGRGVRVFFLFDKLGCIDLPQKYLRSLTDAGVQVGTFNSTKGKANRFQFNFRNHRKIVVVDDRD
jgi:cardiolipin synthase